ncbi:uncharacterized protein [Pyrus communis]|uniref:uncharacterized protein n=1 Tax=Pyrus communis TaxID=23211 RepID=UPI0035BF9EBD
MALLARIPSKVHTKKSIKSIKKPSFDRPTLLEKLKILNLSHSYFLTQSPNFSKLPNLEYLILKGCKSLLEIQHSVGCLERLALVNLKDCIMLKDLPKSFYKLKHVETLVLSGCSRFQNLVADIGEMVSLTTLLIDNTAIEELPYSSIARLKNLTRLSLCGLKLIEPNPSVWPLVLTREYPPELHCSISSEDFRTIDMYSNDFYILPRNHHKRKTTSGNGVIFHPGNDIAKWFTNVDNEGDRVCFQVPETTGSNLKSLIVHTVYSSSLHKDAPHNHFAIFITNHTKITNFVVRPMDPYTITSNEVIWQRHLSNKELSLESGDSIEVYIMIGSGFRVKKTGVHIVWDPELM